MDFRQITQPSAGRPAPVPQAPAVSERKESRVGHKRELNWLQVFNGIMLVGIAVLIAGIAVMFTRGGDNTEHKFIDPSKYQAVFLNNGQVYFGHIQSLSGTYLRMTNIYYLTQNGDSSKASNYTLVKLGCQQIHDPYDQMVINRDQVTFWENLQDDGKVASSIKQFQSQNPKGPDCTQVSTQTQADSSNTQGGSTDATKQGGSSSSSSSSTSSK